MGVNMAAIHITDLEAAINFWRSREPSGAAMALAPGSAAMAAPTCCD